MQTKNQNGRHETTLPACLSKALLFKGGKKSGRRERKQNIMITSGYVIDAPNLRPSWKWAKWSISHSITTLRLGSLNQTPST